MKHLESFGIYAPLPDTGAKITSFDQQTPNSIAGTYDPEQEFNIEKQWQENGLRRFWDDFYSKSKKTWRLKRKNKRSNIIALSEDYTVQTNLKNELLDHLSQFPYLGYSVSEIKNGVEITFNKEVSPELIDGLLSKFSGTRKGSTAVVSGKLEPKTIEELKNKLVLNGEETIILPSLGLFDIEAKIDTGASTSSLHCENIKISRNKKTVSFTPLDISFNGYTGEPKKMKVYDIITVQSSNGMEQERAMIKTDVIIKGMLIETFFTLSDRSDMDYPVLIGKDMISGNFIINL